MLKAEFLISLHPIFNGFSVQTSLTVSGKHDLAQCQNIGIDILSTVNMHIFIIIVLCMVLF